MYNKSQKNRITNLMRQFRVEDKARENALKPTMNSKDVVSTADFMFSPICPLDRVGDSGSLLLAKRKSNRAEQYLVKHEYCDCASNEFVYTKLAQAMGYKMPNVVLFEVSPSEKRKCFKTEYIIGAEYLNIIDNNPSFEKIREHAKNWKEYFGFLALYEMMEEGDSFETPFVDDGFIYRVDTTDSFIASEIYFAQAGINVELNGIVPKAIMQEMFSESRIDPEDALARYDCRLNALNEKYGNECVKPFLEPFERISDVKMDFIEDFLNTLCYFYPDYIGDYFKNYIVDLKNISLDYLRGKQ